MPSGMCVQLWSIKLWYYSFSHCREEHVYDTPEGIELQDSKAEQKVAVVEGKQRKNPHDVTTSAAQHHPKAVPVIKGTKHRHAEITTPAGKHYHKGHKVPVVREKDVNPARSATQTEQTHTSVGQVHFPVNRSLHNFLQHMEIARSNRDEHTYQPPLPKRLYNTAPEQQEVYELPTPDVSGQNPQGNSNGQNECIYQPSLPKRLYNTAPEQQEVYELPTPDVSGQNPRGNSNGQNERIYQPLLPNRLYNTAPEQQEVYESLTPDVSSQNPRGNSNDQYEPIYQPLLPNRECTQQQESIYQSLVHKPTIETPHAHKHGGKQ